jgi:hypothetical protein
MHNGVLCHWRALISAIGRSDEKSCLEQPLKDIGAGLGVERPKADPFSDRQLQTGGLVELSPDPLS